MLYSFNQSSYINRTIKNGQFEYLLLGIKVRGNLALKKDSVWVEWGDKKKFGKPKNPNGKR
jgi:hypothetical protein